ncbi:transcription repressor OFP13 [Ziziphus jujuba]|uniref:Transcription repressor n=1 Tax=Ziziphus jujuba TaxID=326968 RepID=A0A6P3ZE64_ZIZJJ|nr:transcription repressor OFP13 [Ziziphus jujuba]
MAKKIKMKLVPSLFKTNKETTAATTTSDASEAHPWQFYLPSCNHPKTLSFRAPGHGDDIFKTVNSVFFDPVLEQGVETPESWFTNSSESASFSTESEEFDGESLEMVVRGARSERLFFEPGDTSSILDEKAKEAGGDDRGGGGRGGEFDPFKDSLVLAMDSEDPYEDFRRSMKEMVECHGLKDWERLEGLLGWYLKVNGKDNHGFIVGAFVDLLVSLAASNNNNNGSSSSATTTINGSTSFSSAISSFCSSSHSSPLICSSNLDNQGQVEIDDHEEEDHLTS